MINWIDILILLILALSVFLAARKGLSKTLFGLVGVVTAFFVARAAGDMFVGGMLALIGPSPLALALSYVLVFVGVWVGFSLAGSLLRGVLRNLSMGWVDMGGGVVFGLLRGLLLCIALSLFLALAALHKTKAWGESVALPIVGEATRAFMHLPPTRKYREWIGYDKKTRPFVKVPQRYLGKAKDQAVAALASQNKGDEESQEEAVQNLNEQIKSQTASGIEHDDAPKEREKAWGETFFAGYYQEACDATDDGKDQTQDPSSYCNLLMAAYQVAACEANPGSCPQATN
jgi:membrane protein required for colicin V production